MFDGQNLFDACLAFDHVHEWQMDETVTRLVGDGKMEPLIVVGLDNARVKRAYATRRFDPLGHFERYRIYR
jgi:hypothetical protein